MKAKRTLLVMLLLAAAALAACELVGLNPPPRTPDPAARLTSCAAWLELGADEQVVVADRLIGDGEDLLERIRVRQQRPEGATRDDLVGDVAASVTKVCDVWLPRTRRVGEIVDALY